MKCKLAKWKVRMSWMANLYGCTDMQIRWKAVFVTRVGINFSIVVFSFAVFHGTVWLFSLCTLRIAMFQGLDSRKLVFDTFLRIKCYFFSCEKRCLWFHQEQWFMCPGLFSVFFPAWGKKAMLKLVVQDDWWLATSEQLRLEGTFRDYSVGFWVFPRTETPLWAACSNVRSLWL